MEQKNHTAELNQPEQPLSLHTLSSMRSQIINPSTPKRTVSSILKTLTRSLELTPASLHNHHIILKLITDLAEHHPSLSELALDSVRAYSPEPAESPARLAAELLGAMASISEKNLQLEDEFFASLCFNFSSVEARVWLLRNARSLVWAKPALLFALFIGFVQDPYPYVREASLEGLVRLSEQWVFEDVSLVKGAYDHGVQLLTDMENCVRVSAVRVVASWGQMLAAFNADMKTYWSNEVFAKLCSMARDMCMKVRVEVFNGLGKMEIVSEELLLQSLSKRVLVSGKQKKTSGLNTAEQQFATLANSVAGALVHGLEDEFFEVRKSACQSLCALTILSVEFAHEALNWLMDVLNDDSVVVRVQALETMHHMAINGFLELQEKHMHTFLGVLVDNSAEVRFAGRKILKPVQLNDGQLFESTIDGLLKNLDSYPQDEADVFSALSHLGRNHKMFTDLIMTQIILEVDTAFVENPEFNSLRIAALLVLSISAPFLDGDIGYVHPIMFSYASTFLGRIHCAFSDAMDKDALLAYLCEKSRSKGYSGTDINHEEGQLPSSEEGAPNIASTEMVDSETQQSHVTEEPKEVAHYQAEQQQPVYNDAIDYSNYTLAKFPDIWPMVQSGRTNEVLMSLSCWKEELGTMTFDSSESTDALAFTLLYLRIIKLLAEVWEHLLPEKRVDSGTGELELKLGKLERRAIELMSRFVGLSAEEELNVLELVLLTYVLRLCGVELCHRSLTFKRLTATYSRIESLLKERSPWSSDFNFIWNLGRLLQESSSSINEASSSPLPFDKCLKFFSLKQFVFRETITYTRAEVNIPNNDSEHPFPFVPGFRAGIPCEITLRNISSESRLWLRMCMDDDITHHVYLDFSRFEVSGEERKLAFVAPYYRTPKAESFTLKRLQNGSNQEKRVIPSSIHIVSHTLLSLEILYRVILHGIPVGSPGTTGRGCSLSLLGMLTSALVYQDGLSAAILCAVHPSMPVTAAC